MGLALDAEGLGKLNFDFAKAFGPMIGAPISETLGRKAVYLYTLPIYLLFVMGTRALRSSLPSRRRGYRSRYLGNGARVCFTGLFVKALRKQELESPVFNAPKTASFIESMFRATPNWTSLTYTTSQWRLSHRINRPNLLPRSQSRSTHRWLCVSTERKLEMVNVGRSTSQRTSLSARALFQRVQQERTPAAKSQSKRPFRSTKTSPSRRPRSLDRGRPLPTP